MKEAIVFFGGDHQTGTTMLSLSFAERMSEKGKKVLYISGSGKYGDTFLKTDQHHSIDDFKAAIRSGKVEREEFLQSLEKRKSLWILPGVRSIFTAKYFPENTYEVLLRETQDDFDYIILDGGCDVQLGLTISALHFATCRYFVVTQQPKTLYRFMEIKKEILSPLGFLGHLIINQYTKDPALFLKKDILKMLGEEDAEVVPSLECGWLAEMEGKTLLQFKKFALAVNRMTEQFEPTEKRKRDGTGIFLRNVSAKESAD